MESGDSMLAGEYVAVAGPPSHGAHCACLPRCDTTGQGVTALHAAADYEREKCLRALLAAPGIDVNQADEGVRRAAVVPGSCMGWRADGRCLAITLGRLTH